MQLTHHRRTNKNYRTKKKKDHITSGFPIPTTLEFVHVSVDKYHISYPLDRGVQCLTKIREGKPVSTGIIGTDALDIRPNNYLLA